MPRRQHYPLAPTYFACPPLSKKEEAHFVSLGEQSLRLFVDKALAPIGTSWTSLGEHGGMRVFEGPPDRRNKNLVPHRAISTMHGTLHEVAMLHAYESRELCLQHVARRKTTSSSCHLLDMIPLYSFLERTEETPLRQMYVMWRAASISNVPMVKDRDFLYLESQDEFTLEDGRRGWAYCQHSIALPSCPPQALSAMSLLRGSFYHTGCIFMESIEHPGVLDVLGHIAIDFKGSIPMWVRRSGVLRHAAQIGNVEHLVHEQRLTSVPIRSVDDCDSVHLSKRCSLCTRSLSKLFPFSTTASQKQHCCQACGLVVCTRCNQRWRRQDQVVHVCINCSKHIRQGESTGWHYSISGSRKSNMTKIPTRQQRSTSRTLSIAAPLPPPSAESASAPDAPGRAANVQPAMTHPPNATETMDMTSFVERQSRAKEAKRERARQAMYNQLTPGMDRFVALDTVRSDHLVDTRRLSSLVDEFRESRDGVAKLHDLLENPEALDEDPPRDSIDQDLSVVLLDSVAVMGDSLAYPESTRSMPPPPPHPSTDHRVHDGGTGGSCTIEVPLPPMPSPQLPNHAWASASRTSSLSSLNTTMSYFEEPHDKSIEHFVLPALDLPAPRGHGPDDAASLSRLLTLLSKAQEPSPSRPMSSSLPPRPHAA